MAADRCGYQPASGWRSGERHVESGEDKLRIVFSLMARPTTGSKNQLSLRPKPVALAIEARRNAIMHMLTAYPRPTVYPVHPEASEHFPLERFNANRVF